MLKSKKIWGIFAGIFFLYLALKKVDIEKVLHILKNLNYGLIVLMAVSYTLEHFFRALRWKVILWHRSLPVLHAYFGIVIGYLFNNVLPARAGELIRAYYLKKKNVAPAVEVFGSVVFERFLDGIIIIGFMLFSLSRFSRNMILKKAGYTAFIFYFAILVFIVVLQLKKGWFKRITDKLFKYLPENLSERFLHIRDSFIKGLSLIGNPFKLMEAVFLSAVSWAFSVLTMFICVKMFSLNIGVADIIMLMAVLGIGAMIPASPGMIGIYEFCCVLVLNGILGLSKAAAVTFGIMAHSIGYLYVLVVGFAVLTFEGIRISDLKSSNK